MSCGPLADFHCPSDSMEVARDSVAPPLLLLPADCRLGSRQTPRAGLAVEKASPSSSPRFPRKGEGCLAAGREARGDAMPLPLRALRGLAEAAAAAPPPHCQPGVQGAFSRAAPAPPPLLQPCAPLQLPAPPQPAAAASAPLPLPLPGRTAGMPGQSRGPCWRWPAPQWRQRRQPAPPCCQHRHPAGPGVRSRGWGWGWGWGWGCSWVRGC